MTMIARVIHCRVVGMNCEARFAYNASVEQLVEPKLLLVPEGQAAHRSLPVRSL
jgi:hypothetical protein